MVLQILLSPCSNLTTIMCVSAVSVWLWLMFVSKYDMHSFPAQHAHGNTLLPLLISRLLNLWGFHCFYSCLSWFLQMLIGIFWSMPFTVHDLALNPWSCFLNVVPSHSQLVCAFSFHLNQCRTMQENHKMCCCCLYIVEGFMTICLVY